MKFIVKADDFSPGPGQQQWSALFEFAIERGLPLSMGLIGKPTQQALASGSDLPASLRVLIERQEIEVWNHGWVHRRDEFTRCDFWQQLDHIERTQRVLREVGIDNSIFGAPYNVTDAVTPLACAAHPDIRLAYDVEEHGPVRSARDIARCPIENRQIGFDVDPRQFQRNLARLVEKETEVAIIQIHPWRWSSVSVKAFASVVDRIHNDGHELVTLSQWFAGRGLCLANLPADRKPSVRMDELQSRAAQLVADRQSNPRLAHEFFATRYQIDLSDYGQRLTEIGFDETRGKRLRALDVGAGVGQWSLAFAANNPTSSVEATDPGHDFLEILAETVAGTELESRVRVRTLPAELFDYPEDCFDLTLMPGVLMYANHEPVIAHLARITCMGGRHYNAYHQDGHYAKKLAVACHTGDLRSARNWARIFAGIKQFNLGLFDGLATERCLAEENLVGLYEWFGFDVIDRPSVWRHEPPTFGRLPAFCELTLEKRRSPRNPQPGSDAEAVVGKLIALGAPTHAMDLLAAAPSESSEWHRLWARAAVAAGEIESIPPESVSKLDPVGKFFYFAAQGAALEALEAAPQLAQTTPHYAPLVVYVLRQARRIDEARVLATELVQASPDSLDCWAAHFYLESLTPDLTALQRSMDQFCSHFSVSAAEVQS